MEYGIPDIGHVHLIALFVVGRSKKALQLEILAALADLMESDELRRSLVDARDTRSIRELLKAKVGLGLGVSPRRLPAAPSINTILVRQAVELVGAVSVQALLIAVDKVDSAPWGALSEWDGRLVIVTSQKSDEFPIERQDTHLFDVPYASLTRMDRTRLGLLLAASAKLLTGDANVVCVTGPGGSLLDSVTITRPEAELVTMFGAKTTRRSASIRPAVILRTLSLAIELAEKGREGQPLGAIFVVGDNQHVMRHARQLVLNPFHGYARNLRNLLDPSLAETIKEFALIDGAFVVEADGVVLSAGTFLLPKTTSQRLTPGLGTRHLAAAAITAHTQAMAITVSQSTGTVTVFRHGHIVFQLEQATHSRM